MGIRMRRLTQAIAMVAAAGLLWSAGACGSTVSPTATPSTEASGPITVVASINQWGSLAEALGGGHVQVTSILSSAKVEAHDFEPQTADVAKLQKAQIIVANGAGYDSWATKNMRQGTTLVSAAETVGATEGDNPHLWFSKDARNSVAKELSEAFIKILPSAKQDFASRLAAWQKREDSLEQSIDAFKSKHGKTTYAATEAVAYYLMSDLGCEDRTPEGYAQSSASQGEPAPSDLQEFQALIEKRGINLLIDNPQESSDTTNLLRGTAGRSDVPVFDVSEQMPEDAEDITDWITSLVTGITDALAADGSQDGDQPSASASSSGSDTGTTPSNEGQTDPGK